MSEMKTYIHDQTQHLFDQWHDLRHNRITAWRRIYRGVPREKYKSFPWRNASNLVPQIVASFVDQLTAKCVMSIYGIDPLFPCAIVGEFESKDEIEEQRAAIEEWLTYAGKSPDELNLYQAEYVQIKNAIRYGFCAMKTPWETRVEQVAEAALGGSVVFDEKIMYDGPKPAPILFENFMVPLRTNELTQSPMTVHIVTLSEFELRDRAARKLYPQRAVDEILKSPDRYGAGEAQKDVEMDISGSSMQGRPAEEYDLCECYFPYLHNGKRFQIIATYHRKSRMLCRAVFNFYPNNRLPFRLARVGMDGESILGMGFCQMLGVYQEEISQIHNQRIDANTAANTNVLRVSASSPLDSNYSLYPMAILPGEAGEIELMTLGRAASDTIRDEQMTLSLATDRAGVGPSSSGSGSGSPTKKGGYSSQSTFAVMQEGNSRANLNMTDMRYAHLSLGNDLLADYAHFGVSEEKIKALGKMGKHLKKALQSVREGKLCVPVRAATGSVNKEVEKQNKLLLSQHVNQHYQFIQSILAGSQNQAVPPELQRYNVEVAIASDIFFKSLLRDFGFEDPAAIIPESHMKEKLQQMEQPQPQQMPPGMPPVQQLAAGLNPQAVQQMARQNMSGEPSE